MKACNKGCSRRIYIRGSQKTCTASKVSENVEFQKHPQIILLQDSFMKTKSKKDNFQFFLKSFITLKLKNKQINTLSKQFSTA